MAVVVALTLAINASAATVTLTMDEVPRHLIDGLSVTKGGVTFTFSNPNRDVDYGGVSGNLAYSQNPVIQGIVSELFISFSVPVSYIQFAFSEFPACSVSWISITAVHSRWPGV